MTGAGDRGDLRLDLPSLTLKDQQITTLVLTATPGGVLVNGVQVDQQDAVTARTNPSARVRVVADAANRATVSATVNGTTLASGLASPVVGSYALVPAGALTASVQIGGVDVPADRPERHARRRPDAARRRHLHAADGQRSSPTTTGLRPRPRRR